MPLITQSDIAKALDVSRITVSKALNDHADISADMKEKVRKVAKDLGYIPHFHAKNLQSKRTHTIGVVVPDVSNSFFSFAIGGIIDAAKIDGYHIILTVSQEDAKTEKENIMTLLSMRVDGLLVAISKNTTDPDVFKIVRSTETPLVFFDRAFPDLNMPFVGIDDREAAFTLVDHLIRSGYHEIGHLAGSQAISLGQERYKGYVDALSAHNIPVRQGWIIEGGFSKKDGYEGMKKFFEMGSFPQAVFTANDRLAQGAYQAIREAGLFIPEDIGIAALGHAEFAELLSPSLTIIHAPPEKLGARAMEILSQVIRGEDDVIYENRLPVELQVKESTRARKNHGLSRKTPVIGKGKLAL